MGAEPTSDAATTRKGVSPLQDAVEGFGRRGRRLTAARLEAVPDVLIALRGPRVLHDADARHSLALEVEQTLRGAILDMKDPVDRRIAQVVLASEPEFYDDTIEIRKQTVLSGDMAFSANQFAQRRPRIITELVSALQARFAGEAGAKRMPDEIDTFVTQLARSTRNLGTIIYAYDVAALNMHRTFGRPELYKRMAKWLASRNDISDEAMFEYAWSQHLLRKAALHPDLTKWMVTHGLRGYLGGYLDSEFGPDARLGRELIATHGMLEPGPFVDAWIERDAVIRKRRLEGHEWREEQARGVLLMLTDQVPEFDLVKRRVLEPSAEWHGEHYGYGRRVLLEAIGYLWTVLRAHTPDDPLEERDIRTRAQYLVDHLVAPCDDDAWDEPETEGFVRPVLNVEARQMFTEQFFGEKPVLLCEFRADDPELDSLL
ncbi:hypothetical protein [Microbacterium candidum]|uniref:Uncharacterized protein n=1 Tax=Microbacterium candidum TaxID=3041922 RepID=A0ABT7N052_9MICO|nr:hypothetical protein [Microbacterium sp. ASV49]MDL9980091.1 hypothetical protein [Microbacterium sp. ASV49]